MPSSNKRCTVLLTFDFDAESSKEARGNTSPTPMSQGQYGARVGLPRVLALLARYDIRATFFVPGVVVERYPELVRQIQANGHELGHHGYTHVSPLKLTYEEERAQLEKGFAAFQNVLSVRPKGYRSPAWDLSNNSIALFKEFGLEYESSLMGDDFRLYRIGNEDGDTGLVEIPISWLLDDFVHFEIVDNGAGLASPAKVYEIWVGEFDGAYEEAGVFCLTMHPQVIGRFPRVRMLEQLIQYMRGHAGVEFMICSEAVAGWRKQNPA
ncbi:MAG: polysaccharide deacetylase [Ardenticatenaceae bacterium]|nr:polysaccharide deacetylase [Ardenticatenaceae bacterium]MCB8975488.1 polysaccharide deacetylase [Ardenticatenaceae bacterium]